MGKLFIRKAEVIIGELGQKGESFKDFRVSFNIEMSDSKETNTGKVGIFNFPKDRLAILDKNEASLILKVSYDNKDFDTLFIGDIVNYEITEFSNFDKVTNITLKDGYIPLSNNKISLSFGENSNSKQILDRIIKDLNLTKGDYSTLPNYVYKQGFSFLGSPGLALDKILDRLGYQWTISNNTLIISKHNESYNQTIGQFLSNETGLLYAPERINEVFTKTKVKKNKLIDGWKIKSLILPSIQPKGLIRVDSSNVKGDFLVKSVIFNGDTEGQNWFCQIEAIKR